MADLQSVLGTMLATGMGGRSSLGMNDIGSVASNMGAFGGSAGDDAYSGGSSPGLGVGPVAGLGALAYLAYKAFQERQKNMQSSGQDAPQSSPPSGSPWGSQQSGGILGSIFGGGGNAGGSLGDRLSQVFQNRSAPQASSDTEGAYPSLAMEDQRALLLIRAMIAAANADGQISQDERQRILSALDEAGAGPDERRVVENELNHPQSLDTLLQSVRDPQTAEQVYMASQMAIDQDSATERSYLQYLASRLQIDPQRLQQIHRAA
ncbi:tellurite resistance TerB family protein [Azospirillum sp.]|uniref:tellurite resistance TerB family protein n=1 Tax=Azospirillum sp. TaxID=34012 RepID=UPI003D726440